MQLLLNKINFKLNSDNGHYHNNLQTMVKDFRIGHSHNAIFHRNFQKYSVEILYAVIDWVCLGNPK